MVHRRLACLLALGLIALAPAVRGARAAPLPPPTGRIDRMVVDLSGRLGPALEGRRVPALRLLLQVRLPPGRYATGLARLARVAAGLLETRISALGFRQVQLASPLASERSLLARAVRERFDLALRVELLEAGGLLHLRGRLYQARRVLWARLRGATPRLISSLHTSSPVSSEIAAYLSRPARPETISCTGSWTPLGDQPYWGVALGDVDGDGRVELVLLSETRIWVRRWSPVYRRFDTVARSSLAGPPAAVRTRFPLASLALLDLDGDRRLDVLARTSRLSSGAAYTLRAGRLQVLRRLDGYPVGGLRIATRLHTVVLLPAAGRAELQGRSLTLSPPLRTRILLPRRLHRVHLARSRRSKGWWIGAVDAASHLSIFSLPRGRRIATVSPVGAAFALGDLTGDGTLEAVTTEPSRFGARDALTLRRLPSGRPICRVKDFPGSVTAVAVGDVRLDGRAYGVAAIWNPETRKSHLLIVR